MGTQNKTGGQVAARNLLIAFGWEAGIRTPIGGFRVRSPPVRRPPSKGNFNLRIEALVVNGLASQSPPKRRQGAGAAGRKQVRQEAGAGRGSRRQERDPLLCSCLPLLPPGAVVCGC